jgi:hypothetical protein
MQNNLSKIVGNIDSYSPCSIMGLGEKRLLVAILLRAFFDVVTPTSIILKHEAREAATWLHLDRDRPVQEMSNEYFTFWRVCEELDLDPIEVHKNLKREIENYKPVQKKGLKFNSFSIARMISEDARIY